MKKKSLLVLLFAFVLSMAMFMTACGGGSSKDSSSQGNNDNKQEQQNAEPETTTKAELTLEDYLNQHQDIKQSAIQSAEEQGVAIEFKGNELYYYFDLSKLEAYTEELAKNETTIAALDNALTAGKQTFGEVSRDMEKATGVKGVVTVVQYAWGDEILVSRSFTSADAE